MTTQRPDPRLGTELGPYRIEAVIGRGGMGVVYLATQASLGRKVALKVLAPNLVDEEAFRQRFIRESQMAAAIDHPNIVPIYDAGEVDGATYLAMRYVEGVDLASRLRDGPLEPRTAVSVLAQVAGALDAAHAAGLVHRDVKPANLLIASGQGLDRDDHVYLTDFGLTKQRGSQTELTQTGGFLGTLDYIAPEQIEGRAVDGRADQYALAAIAVACLTGQVPFPRDTDVAVISAHLHDAPPSVQLRRPELPVEVDAVVARGMAKDPDQRYPDCQAFVNALRDALGVTSTHVRPIPRQLRSSDRRIPLLIGGLLVVGLVVGAGFVIASSRTPDSGPNVSPGLSGGLGEASPSVSPEASPTEDVFPNEAETALLEGLPADLKTTCERGSYGVIVGHSGGSAPLASLQCTPPSTAGASQVVIRQFPPPGVREALVAGFISALATGGGMGPGSLTGDGREVPPGDCATSPRANGRWTLAGEDVGAIVCYTVASSGDAFLWWGYDDEAILVRAVDQRGDSAALYDWFEQNARFIAP